MNVSIAGLGVWLPEQVRSNDAWPVEFTDLKKRKTKRELIDLIPDETDAYIDSFVELALKETDDPFLGSKHRRVAPDDVHAHQAETLAAQAALEDAGLDPSDIDVTLAYSSVPDCPAQPSAPRVAAALGVKGPAYSVDAGCAAVLAQVQVASALIQTGQARRVLLCQSNLAQRVFFPMSAVGPSMGDAATAVILTASEQPGLLGLELDTIGSEWESLCWVPRNREATQWFSASCGGWTLGTKDRRRSIGLMANSVRYGVQTVNKVLDRCGMAIEDVDVLAATQAREWMPRKIAEGLGLPSERAPSTYLDYGSIGPCTPWLNLWVARDRNLIRNGGVCALYVQGISFTVSAALFRYRW